MFRSYRYVLIAVVGWLVCSPLTYAQQQTSPTLESQPVAPSQQGDANSGKQDNAPDEQPKPEILTPALQKIESAIRDIVPPKDEAADQRQEDRDKADLQAQEDMAFWAKLMFLASALTVAVTFGGLVLIWRTLHHTKRAANSAVDMVNEARLTTKAAQDAIEVTREIGEAQVRAYLTCTEAKYTISKTSIFCQLVIANKGLSPADRIEIQARLIPQKPLKGIEMCEAEDCEPISAGSVGNASFAGEFSKLGDEVKDSIHSKMQPFAIQCIISWRDVFKKEQEILLWLHVPLYEISILKPLLKRGFTKREDVFTIRHDEIRDPEAEAAT